ncbi:MAG TPA: chorismate lyase [Gammaproteobacteria bacterium]|nr:chorismate lyase [Gammaproteobacteria bacterium]
MQAAWQPMNAASLGIPDRGSRGWLAERGQLTHRLCEASGGYTVEVEDHSEATLSAAEAELLGCEVQPALLREIVLRAAGGEPCVFARTLVPADTLRVHGWLANLGGMPLGAALEPRTDVSRSGFEIARLQPGDELYVAAAGHVGVTAAALWARRSIFRVGAGGILVYEVFLPAVGRYASSPAHEL